MPLVRFEVRNEYAMGDPELYRLAVKKEDPKPVLDGIAVAGLVGILRQLGDMAEFAADIFHDLHEEVIATSARGRKVLTRVRNIEAALPSIEKAVKGQTSHIHLAYIPGCDWHARVKTERSHLLSSDLPRFMMDSYEECRDPPRLYLLDKFDSGGSGTCLKRYSDPTFFHKAWDMLSKVEKAEKAHREKKYNKIKRKGSHNRNGGLQHSSTMSQVRNSSDMLISSQLSTRFRSTSIDLESISDNRSAPDLRSNPDMTSRSTSFGSKSRLSLIDHNTDPNPHEETNLASIMWKEKTDVGPTSSIHCDDVIMDKVKNLDPGLKPGFSPGNLNLHLSEESEIENFADALNTMESETEMENEYCDKLELCEKTKSDSDSDSDSKMVVSNTGKMHESSENSQIAPKEELSHNDSFRFIVGNGNGNGQSVLDAQLIKSGNEISHVDPPINSSSQEIKSEIGDSFHQESQQFSQIDRTESTDHLATAEINSDLEDESPRVRTIPKIASNLNEFPQFSEITPLVLPAHPGSQKIEPNVESSTSDFDAKINVENNAPYVTNATKPDITNAPFVNGPAKLWTNAGLFGLEPSKPNVSIPNGSAHSLNPSENTDKLTDNSTPKVISSHENEAHQTVSTYNISSSFSNLAQRFLTNSLQKGISQSPSLSNTNTSNTDLNFPKSNEPKSTKISDGSSSPPLEFMKIFIQPSNGNLNLNSNSDDSTEYQNPIFPDIQILQGSEYQNESDSDEDTFCRSYVYSSDDQLSPILHSNSDVWDQENIPECFENIRFDQTDLPGIESVVFDLSKSQNENDESFVPFINQESLVENHLMPPPPPLPPAQWRVNKPSVSSSMESQVPLPPSFPTELFQPKSSKRNEKLEKNGDEKGGDSGKEVNLETEVLQWHRNKMDQQKLNGHDKPKKETFEAKDLDEREDLLDQIRKKSFNLRRTMTPKPNPDSSQTATNSSVSAILEKANAIRQAFVGSDDGGDDDGWSDV